MKSSLLLLCACMAAVLTRHTADADGCIQIDGICVEDCPPGTHAYDSDCMAPTWSQRTCASPQPHDMGAICDLSRCDCDEPTLMDEATGECELPEDCSTPPPATSSSECIAN